MLFDSENNTGIVPLLRTVALKASGNANWLTKIADFADENWSLLTLTAVSTRLLPEYL